MKRCLYILAIGGIALICGLQAPFSRAAEPVTVTPPKIVLERIKGDLQFTDPSRLEVLTDTVVISVNGSAQSVVVERGKASVPYTFAEAETLQIIYDSQALPGIPVRPIPLWLSILPPLIAIAMAFLIKEVYSSLFIGILVGATIIAYYQGASAILAVFVGMLDIVDNYVITTISDHGHRHRILDAHRLHRGDCIAQRRDERPCQLAFKIRKNPPFGPARDVHHGSLHLFR